MNFNIIKNKINAKGFTIIELMVMMGIIAVVAALVIGGVASLMNNDAGNEQNARSMYYSMQGLMTNIKLTSALPKNDDGEIELSYQPDASSWLPFSTSGKNYYFEIKVTDCAIEEFRFMVCESSDLETALGYSGINYGDNGGSFYFQNSEKGNTGNDNAWTRLKERIEPFVADDESEGEWYYFIAVDSDYRVSKVYYSQAPFSTMVGKTFSADGYIDDVGKVAAFPVSASNKDQTAGG